MTKKIITIGVISSLFLFSCNQGNHKVSIDQEVNVKEEITIPLVLPAFLEYNRSEFEINVKNAVKNIESFAAQYGWSKLTTKEFMDSVMIFDNKRAFDINILRLVDADTTIELPESFCAALERRTLVAVSPEIYSKVYPEGIEENSYEKLLTHEIAHRLHIRILNGDEEAMGPVWFYEGFALFTANQFANSNLELNEKEIKETINNPERGSYINYSYVFRYIVQRKPLKELISKAKNENFNEWVLTEIISE